MADCIKAVEFLREHARMCKDELDCTKCPLKEVGDGSYCLDRVGKHPDKAVSIVQKWSDEHPVMTWESKLRELLPGTDIEAIIHFTCPKHYFGDRAPFCSEVCFTDAIECEDCWNSEYKEE